MSASRSSKAKSPFTETDSEFKDGTLDDPYPEDERFGSESGFDDEEVDNGRISRALHDWMPDYTIVSIAPREHVPREPVFSGRLGRAPRVKRAPSMESIATELSLLSCSTLGPRPCVVRRTGKKKKVKKSAETTPPPTNKWIELANRRDGGVFDKMFKNQAAQIAAALGGASVFSGTHIYDMLDDEEKKMIFACALKTGLNHAPGMKKSDSTGNIATQEKRSDKRRGSEGTVEFTGRPINFQELKRKMMQQKLALIKQKSTKGLPKKRQSLVTSKDSLVLDSTATSISSKPASRRSSTHSVATCNMTLSTPNRSRASSPSVKNEKPVNVWKGDQQILEMDLRKELTSKVKTKIASTTKALKRVTGMGDSNEQTTKTNRHLSEFPGFTDEEFAHFPKIEQKIRISPQLSHVIQQDIRVRMGRPRYHEISIRDMELWDRGQLLDRSHRNLKVFNWLHSLQEDRFEINGIESELVDLQNGDVVDAGFMIHIESVDEPTIKPLFERQRQQYIM